ncbi:MAG: quinolinate synthase NadA [Dehalococcoidia bacterium]|nr:quinolinate synthase NadA [Dehalococcoidia bacterium]
MASKVASHLPKKYMGLADEEYTARILAAKAKLGTKLVILGHHYQRDEIIRFADFRGDSLNLARNAAEHPEAEYIVFCGVHFMAESADILSGPHQKVILPNMSAGCSMADMAPTDDVLQCWDELQAIAGVQGQVTPVTYINSTAALKAFCGINEGAVCTSSNAKAILAWALKQRPKVLFFPDQHLGRNTAFAMGIPLDEMVVWDPVQPLGGNSEETLRKARILLWKGHCSVHKRFTVEQVREARAKHPGIKILVHPECTLEVVQEADYTGSTEYIVKTVRESAAGSQWAIGTEINLVNRLAKEHRDKLVFCLDPVICPCSTMYRIHPAYLAWVLEEMAEGRVVNQVAVPEQIAHWAKVALGRMLATV